jgi:hypothetical protein
VPGQRSHYEAAADAPIENKDHNAGEEAHEDSSDKLRPPHLANVTFVFWQQSLLKAVH